MSAKIDDEPLLASKEPRFKTIRFLLRMIFFLPLVCVAFLWALLGILAMVVVGIYAVVSLRIREVRAYFRMRRQDRIITKANLLARIEKEGGTGILESPAYGWGLARIWWTPDDILSGAPIPPAERPRNPEDWDLSFDEWCHNQYTDLDSGRALLYSVWRGRGVRQSLVGQFPGLRFVEVWSGLLALGWLPQIDDDSVDDDASTQ